jgi:hypothetical protein
MRGPREITIEGYIAEELLHLTDEQLAAFVFIDEPLLFRAGTATLLGQFRLQPDRLTVELAQVDGGGEGVLPALWRLAERYARRRGLREVEWIVHALACARPNPKLRRVLQRRGFVVRDVPEIGRAYHYLHTVPSANLPGTEAPA